MPDEAREVFTASILPSLGAIEAEAWDACAGRGNPFLRHAFLSALEESESVTAETGWLPRHVVVQAPDGRLAACVPLYLKGHSYGEYVFDHAWAHAFERAGGEYYPKLQCAVPFTPVPGPRLLIHPEFDRAAIEPLLFRTLANVAEHDDVSSVHITFLPREEWNSAGEVGWLRRSGLQYHWPNRGYENFDGFLAALSSRKRKAIKRERRKIAEAGVTFRALCGDALREEDWDSFYRFYLDTVERKWGGAYLNREFFARLHETMASDVVLIMADYEGRPIGGALNLKGEDALFGRNWGSDTPLEFLHFETCYYQAIDYAITHGLDRVEAGAQGEHKIQRGYCPVETYSAHLIRHRGLREAIDNFLEREREAVTEEIAYIAQETPYRKAC